MSNNLNIDRVAARCGQEVVSCLQGKAPNVENIITKALGVLQEDGVYACFLYLYAKEKTCGGDVVKKMLALLEELGFGKPGGDGSRPDVKSVLEFITDKVADNLESLLLAREAIEKMLIYARYSAKAGEEGREEIVLEGV